MFQVWHGYKCCGDLVRGLLERVCKSNLSEKVQILSLTPYLLGQVLPKDLVAPVRVATSLAGIFCSLVFRSCL